MRLNYIFAGKLFQWVQSNHRGPSKWNWEKQSLRVWLWYTKAVKLENRLPVEEILRWRSLEAEKGKEQNSPLEPRKEQSPAKLWDPGLISESLPEP